MDGRDSVWGLNRWHAAAVMAAVVGGLGGAATATAAALKRPGQQKSVC